MKRDMIKHVGVVKKIEGSHLTVLIETETLCSKCHAKGACNAFDKQDKYIDVFDTSSRYKIDDKVTVLIDRAFGIKAVLICYVIPLILMVVTIVLSVSAGLGDGVAGLLAILILVPYYLLLFLFKDKFLSDYKFQII